MTKSFIRSGVATGTLVSTERGKITVENLQVSDSILTEQKTFVPVQKVQKNTAPHHYVLAVHGLEPIELEADAQVMVRDVEIVENNGTFEPRMSWPYWIAVKDINVNRHMILSPFNPHAINPYGIASFKNNPSSYHDEQEQLWLQIAEVTYVAEPIEVVRVHVAAENGVTYKHIIVK